MERKCEKCGGLGGEHWNYPDGSEGGVRCDACDGFGCIEDGAVDETIRKASHFVAEAMMENGDPGFAKAVLAGGYDNGNSVKAVCKALSAFAAQQPQYTAQQIAESFRAGQSTERMQPRGVPEVARPIDCNFLFNLVKECRSHVRRSGIQGNDYSLCHEIRMLAQRYERGDFDKAMEMCRALAAAPSPERRG